MKRVNYSTSMEFDRGGGWAAVPASAGLEIDSIFAEINELKGGLIDNAGTENVREESGLHTHLDPNLKILIASTKVPRPSDENVVGTFSLRRRGLKVVSY